MADTSLWQFSRCWLVYGGSDRVVDMANGSVLVANKSMWQCFCCWHGKWQCRGCQFPTGSVLVADISLWQCSVADMANDSIVFVSVSVWAVFWQSACLYKSLLSAQKYTQEAREMLACLCYCPWKNNSISSWKRDDCLHNYVMRIISLDGNLMVFVCLFVCFACLMLNLQTIIPAGRYSKAVTACWRVQLSLADTAGLLTRIRSSVLTDGNDQPKLSMCTHDGVYLEVKDTDCVDVST